jgi:hypothetical protein
MMSITRVYTLVVMFLRRKYEKVKRKREKREEERSKKKYKGIEV